MPDFVAYNDLPDFARPVLDVHEDFRKTALQRLSFLYGEDEARSALVELERRMAVHYAHKPAAMIEAERSFDAGRRFSQRDMVLITYGDLLLGEELSPLETLARFVEERPALRRTFNTLHILPFFPYSSDKGFSVIDFHAVDPSLGSWEHIGQMGRSYRLMFDGVLNHISSLSPEFREFLNGNPDYDDYFTAYVSPDDLTPEQRALIVRPRTTDVLSRFDSIGGPLWVWSTFSSDQIDLNYHSPKVLLDVIDTLLLYVRRGADLIRLDAVTYLWEEPGTPCVSLEQTHQIIKLCRDVLDVVAPPVALVTETNVPHAENVSYFGSGYDEAQMVYNFALPPLVLHSFYRQDASFLTAWAKALDYPSDRTTFFNILDTHDGIGVMGVRDILPAAELDFMVERAREHGAYISYKAGGDGSELPYEINSTWFSALNQAGGDLDLQAGRYAASRSIALALRGVPGIYFHGLIGSLNNVGGAVKSGVKRDINRGIVHERQLLEQVWDRESRTSVVLEALAVLLRLRTEHAAFDPAAAQEVLELDARVFALRRCGGSETVLCMVNVSGSRVVLKDIAGGYDLVAEREHPGGELVLGPYGVCWLLEQ